MDPEQTPKPDLSRINTPEVSAEADPKTALERERLENQRLQAEVAGLTQDTAERKRYALCFFVLACVWIAVITAVLLLQGFGFFCKWPFKLSEPIVLAVIGSTTVNVLGILYVVANYLFPKRGQ
jgi:hypothetical protein